MLTQRARGPGPRRAGGNGQAARTAAAACALAACALAAGCHWSALALADSAQEPIVRGPGESIGFTRSCADESPYTVRAYARMESKDGRAAALVRLMAGYWVSSGPKVVVGASLVALEFRAGESWASAPYALKARFEATGKAAETAAAETYQVIHDARPFRAGPDGRGSWLDFDEQPRDPERSRTHRLPPFLGAPAAALGVDDAQTPVATALVIANQRSGGEIELLGPALRIPQRIWEATPPAPRSLGLAAALNPFQEGGVWQTIRRGWRHRHCVDERKIAKRAFQERLVGAAATSDGPAASSP